jgi:2,6-dioxo-6-phenylhexa-3-enoate hydrolase
MTETASYTEEATGRSVKVDGLEIRYHDAGSGAPLVLLHGGGPGDGGWASYGHNVPGLAQRFRVLLPDLPQFGRSTPAVIDEPRGVYYARIVRGFLDALGIDKAHVVGQSMGAGAALKLAIDHPDRLNRLVAIAPHIGVPSTFMPMPSEGIKRLNEVFANPTVDTLREMMKVLVCDAAFATDAFLAERVPVIRNETILEARRKSFAGMYDLTPELGKIQARTLLVWGREDRFIPLDFALTLLARIPEAHLYVFPRCGHWVQYEAGAGFERLLTGWLSAP